MEMQETHKVAKIPQIMEEMTDKFILRYRPALFAFEHGDLGHTLRWLASDHVRCSCGVEVRSRFTV